MEVHRSRGVSLWSPKAAHRATEAHPVAMKVHPEVIRLIFVWVEAHSGSMEDHPVSMEAYPVSM